MPSWRGEMDASVVYTESADFPFLLQWKRLQWYSYDIAWTFVNAALARAKNQLITCWLVKAPEQRAYRYKLHQAVSTSN